jgi:hypothetical protein
MTTTAKGGKERREIKEQKKTVPRRFLGLVYSSVLILMLRICDGGEDVEGGSGGKEKKVVVFTPM